MSFFTTGFLAAGFFAAGFFGSSEDPPVVPALPTQQSTQSAGGAGEDAGRGYVWKDNAWVKATKFARVGISAQFAVLPETRAGATAKPHLVKVKQPEGKIVSRGASALRVKHYAVRQPEGMPIANNQSIALCTSLRTSSYNGACEVLSIDEILTLMELVA